MIRPEILDLAGDAEAHRNLGDLRQINRWFGAHRILRPLVAQFYGPRDRFTVLDVGAASGDMGDALRLSYPEARVVSLDQSQRNLRDTVPPKIVADAFRLPLRDRSFDLVMCHLFLHHFQDESVVELLRSMYQVSRRGLIVMDLERHIVARKFLPATQWLFRWNEITLHDGPISVDAAFHLREFRALAQRAGFRGAIARRHLPWFRLSLTVKR